MSKSTEDLIDERRKGFVIGLAVSELMLLILFALLLFLVEGLSSNQEDREIVEALGGKEAAVNLGNSIDGSSEIQRILQEQPEIIDLWISLTTSGVIQSTTESGSVIEGLSKTLAEVESTRADLERQLVQQQAEAADLNDRLTAANSALMAGVRMGGTTLCTYSSPTVASPRPRSVPLGVVFLQEDGLTLISRGYEPGPLIDAYGESIDPTRAVEVISSWELNKRISFDEFQVLNRTLEMLGDEYATESRQNCRYYFDYYFDDINADTLNLWNRLNYSGVKISSDRFEELREPLSSSPSSLFQ